MKVTDYSLAQTKRLIRQYATTGLVVVKQAHSNGFKTTYTEADVRLLARMDELHEQPSGAVLKKLCERAYLRFEQEQYQRLATLSISHLYNLRTSKTDQRQRCILRKNETKSSRHRTPSQIQTQRSTGLYPHRLCPLGWSRQTQRHLSCECCWWGHSIPGDRHAGTH